MISLKFTEKSLKFLFESVKSRWREITLKIRELLLKISPFNNKKKKENERNFTQRRETLLDDGISTPRQEVSLRIKRISHAGGE